MPPLKGPRKLTAEELYEYAVKALAAHASSTGDLRTKLRKRALDGSNVEEVIARLKDHGYLDDRRFAESFASWRLQNEGFGRTRILSDLRSRRITGNLADRAVEQAIGERSEAELVRGYLERRMPSAVTKGIRDERELASAYRKLRRAGFGTSAIMAELRGLTAKPELLDDSVPEEEDEEQQ